MTTSQSDVDKVMAAFGAAPLHYRPNQDLAARPDAESRAESTGGRGVSSFVIPSAPASRASERILPGAGGRVREIFPLLWRAIPVAGDLKIGAIKRAGDEVPETTEPDTSDDRQLAARIQAASGTAAPVPAPPVAVLPTVEAPRPAPSPPAPSTAAVSPVHPAKIAGVWPFLARAEIPPIAEPAADGPSPPLRSHADVVRPIVRRAPAAETAPGTAQPGAPQPATLVSGERQPAAPRPTAPQPGEMPPPFYPAAAYPPPPPGYPYYPPQGMPPYPMHPAAMAWPPAAMAQPGLPPQGYPPFYGPAYAPPAPGYPPYHPAGYPPPYPQGYPPQAYPPPLSPPVSTAAYYAPAPYPMPPPAAAAAAQPPQSASPISLSDIFAALHRAPPGQRGEGAAP
jgi:hypothetical protein